MENKKTLVNYVLILSGILIVLLLAIFFISNRPSSPKKIDKSNSVHPPPTSYPLSFKNKNSSTSFATSPTTTLPTIPAFEFTGVKEMEVDPKVAASANDAFALRKKLPLKRGNLKINFDYEKEIFVISPINDQVFISDKEKQELLNWLKENYPHLDQSKIIYSSTPFISPTPKKININITPAIITSFPNSKTQENKSYNLVDFFKILFDETSLDSRSADALFNQSSAKFSKINYTPPKTHYPYIYYPQRNGPFDDYPLPKGCNINYAGCGPTTVAMIVASYKKNKSVNSQSIVKQYNPITIVNQYDKYNYYLGCDGSRYTDAMSILRSYGVKVGGLIFSNVYYKAEEAAPQFKNFINAGKTIFALANFRADGGGHYFWVIDVDKDNNIWAFDSAYGATQIPYNENSRYPFPLYRLAFTVSP